MIRQEQSNYTVRRIVTYIGNQIHQDTVARSWSRSEKQNIKTDQMIRMKIET